MTDKIAGEGGFIPSCEEAFHKAEEATKQYESEINAMAI